ncbi:MAG: hypothetical protein ABS44_07775 [Chryseobacterium sp. SCN 40-13]|nr:MAG: hypothetical protein ABS44_07775 [Chryseobacterium sp. SCN 40-13]
MAIQTEKDTAEITLTEDLTNQVGITTNDLQEIMETARTGIAISTKMNMKTASTEIREISTTVSPEMIIKTITEVVMIPVRPGSMTTEIPIRTETTEITAITSDTAIMDAIDNTAITETTAMKVIMATMTATRIGIPI